MIDGWVCPRCGQTGIRHGRAGARGCKTSTDSPHCRGLECECEDGRCFSKRAEGYGWRRSPCPTARCYHCGWEGIVRSRDFERAFGLARCPKSNTGWHHPTITWVPNTVPNVLVLRFKCAICGRIATRPLHPVEDIQWHDPEPEPEPEPGT
jgi:hypothetical protein